MTQEILAKLQQILIAIAGLVAPLSVLLREAQIFTREATPYHVSNQVDAIATNLNDPTHGLAALQSQIATFQATTAVDFTAVLTAVAAAQQTGSPVTLPTTPPAGYGFNSTSDVAAIWAYLDPTYSQPMYLEVGFAYALATLQNSYGMIPSDDSAYFDIRWDATQAYLIGPPSWFPPKFNLSSLARSDTVLSILASSNPAITFTLMPDGQHYKYYGISPYELSAICLVDDAWLNALKDAVLGPVGGELAPIWPGLSGVTLGTAVALTNGLTITGPLAGVIVTITSVPYPISSYPFGAIPSYVRAGAALFIDDNAQAEFPQPLGPNAQVLLPKSMTEAGSVVFRVATGVVGTAQPFTIP